MIAPPWTVLLWLAAAADPRAQLEAVKARKAQEEAAAAALHRRETSVLSALDASERSWSRVDALARAAAADHAAAATRLEATRAAEAAARDRVEAIQRALAPRLRVRARMGQGETVHLLASSTSLGDLVKRRYLWSRVTERDLQLLGEARQALEAAARARETIERDTAEVARLATEAEEQRAGASLERDRHRALLGSVRAERSLHERAAAEAAQQELKLAEFVGALPPTHGPSAHAGFASLRGKLPLPVSGTVAAGFGPVVNPRFNTVTVQKGLDLRAAPGARVRAVAPGTVVHAGWFKGYGNLVIVDHGEGYHTLVAYLASLSTAAGEEVQAGTVLGSVGDDSSPRGPYLYFEIREKGRPVDPSDWVRPQPPR